MTLNDLRVGGLQKSLFLVCSGWFKKGLQRIHASHLVINVLAFSYACFVPARACAVANPVHSASSRRFCRQHTLTVLCRV